MKKSLIALMLCTSVVHAEFLDGNKLLSLMNTSSATQQINALSYIAGVSDSLQGVMACPPPNVKLGQIYDMTKKVLEETPSERHNSADSFVRFVLIQTWPCKRNGKDT
jgi:hypothetical protein